MQTTWLIEADAFPKTAQQVIDLLEVLHVPWLPWPIPPDRRPPGEGAVVLFWGSLGAAYTQRVADRWRPGAIGPIEVFHNSTYHRPLHPHLANPDAIFTTAAQLVAEPSRVLAPLGCPDRIFVRPDSPLKPFSGRVVRLDQLSLEALDHGFYYDDPQLPILACPVQQIEAEHRFVIAGGRVVGGCTYDPDRSGRGRTVPEAAERLAEQIGAAPWQAAELYVVDVGLIDGRPRVLELNPFSGADLYDCPTPELIEAACGVARRLSGA